MVKKSFLILAFISLVFTSCYLGRGLIYLYPDIDDHKRFPSNYMHAHNKPFVFYKGFIGNNSIPHSVMINGKPRPFEEFLVLNKTVAYLIIKEDSIIYERYLMNKDSSSVIPSFSMAKSYTSALIGCAIKDGLIQSVDEPITNYIPELKPNGFDSITIRHLLQMTSGIKFKESYKDPFGEAAKLYYGNDAKKYCKELELIETPGTQFRYNSGNTQLLGWVLQRALKGETITHYLDRRIWFRLEPEFDGSWSVDKSENGLEKTFCCLNATARDFAKFGRLYLNNGMWNGKEIIPAEWVKESLRPELKDGGVDYYKYQWWIRNKNGEDAFMAWGHLGQYIYVYPSKKLIIVRLGEDYGNVNWPALFSDYARNME